MRRVTLLSLVLAALGARAHADPIAFVVNNNSGTVSAVDVTARVTLGSFSTSGSMPASSGLHPKGAVYDAKSGRLFVAGDNRLMGFDARAADGRGQSQTPAANSPSGIALDDAGRRIFMSHKNLGVADGLVEEFSIADPSNPAAAVQHAVRNVPDLRFIAWDAKFKRVYVVDSTGVIARSSPGGWTFTSLSGTALRAASIVADPVNGGVWIATRFPGRIVRVDEAGSVSATDILGTAAPGGLSWDPAAPTRLLVALEDLAVVVSFDTVRLIQPTAVMNTFDQPVAAARSQGPNGKLVSANKIGSKASGSVTVDGVTQAFVGDEPVAMVVTDLPRLFPDPASYSYCYNQLGDSGVKTFVVRNTRVDRTTLNLAAPAIGGLNPLNYSVTSSSCNAVSLAWGNSCSFTLRFVAQGSSVEPPSPFPSPIGGFRPPTWPAVVTVAATNDASAGISIPVRAGLSASLCVGSGLIILH